ncbi:hypothetical protein BDP27DRAFT_1362385 [Rhodocollybia butyracea]|uniref:Uncharacterized protein n=1 Tax=Rhodocollybia butyracea TaxID=206335 RepID=A0A9P5U998_9AGAR|nr:hypothetical protein BDP27DRAFT_1362385 [Rhodocollybia butyracea]
MTATRRQPSIDLPPSFSRRPKGSEVQHLPTQDPRPSSKQVAPAVTPVTKTSSLSDNDVEMMSPQTDFQPPPPVSASSSSSRREAEAIDFIQSAISALPNTRVTSPLVTHNISSLSQQVPSKERALWTGEIVLELPSDDGSPALHTICTEGMLMPIENGRQPALAQGAIPLKVAMSYNKPRLSMRSFYSIDILNSVFAACNPVHEWGWLCSESDEETGKLKKVAQFMLSQKLIASVPVSVESDVVALLLLYPSTFFHDCLPRVFASSLGEITLITALYSWTLKADDRNRAEKTRKPFYDRMAAARSRKDPRLPDAMYQGVKAVEGGPSRFKSAVKQVVRMLELPNQIHEYLRSGPDRSRPFALWPPRDSEIAKGSKIPAKVSDIEAEMLLALLTEYPSTVDKGFLGKEQDLRVIFAHVSSLGLPLGKGNIRDIPGLSRYRQSNDLRFIVYGSSDAVNPRVPNIMDEIWHIGGIVTFTPSALLLDPQGVFQRIQQLEEHEFWVCYILPAVIGMVVSTTYHGKEHIIQKRISCKALDHRRDSEQSRGSPMDVDDEFCEPVRCTCEGFVYEWLLKLVDDESISVVGAPPLPPSDPRPNGTGSVVYRGVVRDGKPRSAADWEKLSASYLSSSSAPFSLPSHSPTSLSFPDLARDHPSSQDPPFNNPFDSWIMELFDNDMRSSSERLEFCLNEFQRLCGNLPREEWEEVLRKEAMKDLGRMQISRGFREDLRRFVVFTGTQDRYIDSDKGGFEWVTPDSFRFHDETDEFDPFDIA